MTARRRTGNIGIIPIVFGELAIVIFFGFKATNFFTAVNFGNIIIQMAGTTMLAYGVVFVLLLRRSISRSAMSRGSGRSSWRSCSSPAAGTR